MPTNMIGNRRGFLRAATASVVVGTSTLAAPAIAQGRLRLRMATCWPKNFPGLGTSAQRLADAITTLSDGRIEVKLFAAGELVPAFEVFDAVREGTADMGHAAAAYWMSKNKSIAFFGVVPGGLVAQEHNAWIAYGGGQELWDEIYGAYGLKAFACGNTGTQMGGWFNREIRSIDDFQGLRMRIPGLAGEVINRAGGVSINMPGAEILTSLQSGVVDAVEFAGPWTDLAFGFHKVANLYYGPGFHEAGASIELMINRSIWDSLQPTQQALIATAAGAENERMLSEFTAGNAESLNALVNSHGIMPEHFPDEVVRRMLQLSAEVVAETAALGDVNRRVYESWSAFRKRVATLAPYTEQGAMNQRDL